LTQWPALGVVEQEPVVMHAGRGQFVHDGAALGAGLRHQVVGAPAHHEEPSSDAGDWDMGGGYGFLGVRRHRPAVKCPRCPVEARDARVRVQGGFGR
jgi:hypothetical protein